MIIIKKNKNEIVLSGHANYSNTLDIVCASVSSIMYTTVTAISRIDDSKIDFKDTVDKVIIKYEDDKIINILIENMMSLFKELASDYPKNIKIEMEE